MITDNPLLVGLDVGTTKICALVGETDELGALRILGVGIEPARGMRKGVVVNVEEATHAIAPRWRRPSAAPATRSARPSSAWPAATLPRSTAAAWPGWAAAATASTRTTSTAPWTRPRPLPSRTAARCCTSSRAASAWTGRMAFATRWACTASAWRWRPTSSPPPRPRCRTCTKCVEAAGVQVEAYVLNPLASAEVVLTDTEKEMGVVVCDIGGGTTDLAIYIDGNVWHTMVLSVGGNHLTSDIAHGLRLPADMAEKIKIEHGHASAEDVASTESFTMQPFGEDRPVQIARRRPGHHHRGARGRDVQPGAAGSEAHRLRRSAAGGRGAHRRHQPAARHPARGVGNAEPALPHRRPGQPGGPGRPAARPGLFTPASGLLRWAQHESQARRARRSGRRNGNGSGRRACATWTWARVWTCSSRLLP